MASTRYYLPFLDGGATITWEGRVAVPARLADGGSSDVDLVRILISHSDLLTFSQIETDGGDVSDRVETRGSMTMTDSEGNSVTISFGGADRSSPYNWTLTPDIIAWAAHQRTLADNRVLVELSDGVDGDDDGDLNIPTIPGIFADIYRELSYELVPAEGGIQPHRYTLLGVPRDFSFDPDTRILSGTATSGGTGVYNLRYHVRDAYGELATQMVSFVVRHDPRPIWKIEVDWDGDESYSNDHSDVTHRLLDVQTCKRGRNFSGGFFGVSIAGILNIRLWDEDRLYDRFNPRSALLGKVLAGRSVRVYQLAAGVYGQIWGGVLDDVRPIELSGRRMVSLRALGPLSLMPRRTIDIPMHVNITIANAATELLRLMSVPGSRIGTLLGDTVIGRWFGVRLRALDAIRALEEAGLGFVNETRLGKIALDAPRADDGETVLAFASPEVDRQPGEVGVIDLSWSDPLKDLATRVVIPISTYLVDTSPGDLWQIHSPLEIAGGASIRLTARIAGTDIVGVDSWETITGSDYSANDSSDDSGTDRSADVVVGIQTAGLAATVTIENTSSTALYLTGLTLRGTAVRIAAEYDEELVDQDAFDVYGDLEYRLNSHLVNPEAASLHARRILNLFARPASRGYVKYEQISDALPPDLSDIVTMRFAAETRAYYVENVDQQWRRGAGNYVDLVLNEVDVIPSARAPSVSINPVPAGLIGSTVQLSAALIGGVYDGSVTYAWEVSGGALNDATVASPRWTRPIDAGDYTVSLRVTVRGTGVLARQGTSHTSSDSVNAEVNQPPVAEAPGIEISLTDGFEGESSQLSAVLTGGVYDNISYAWEVSGGMLDDATIAMPSWTRPSVDADTVHTVTLEVTVRGDGTMARSATSDTAIVSVETTVENVLVRMDTDTIYRLSASQPATPTGGESDEVHLPTGWSRSEPSPTVSQSVWASSRTRTYAGSSFTSATAWGIPTEHQSTDTDTIYRLSASQPETPTGGESDEVHLPTGWSRTEPSPTASQSVWASSRTRTYAGSSFTSATAWGIPTEHQSTDTDTIYRLSASQPATPTGGTSNEDHLPTGWSRSEPSPTVSQSVWASSRTRSYSGGSFASATAWSTPTEHRRIQTDTIYQLAASQPATPTGGQDDEDHLPDGWSREDLSATTTESVWSSVRTRSYIGADFTSATAWGTPTEHEPAITSQWSDWAEVEDSRSTDWGGYSGTSSYRGSCSSRERRYDRSGTESWTERRTNTDGRVETRTRTRDVSESEWRSAPESGVWSGWSEVAGSRTTNRSGWSATSNYRGSCASRERQYSRTATPQWTERRTNPCQTSQTRSRTGSSTTESEWRSAPESGVWSGWSEVPGTRSTSSTIETATSDYRGSCASRERKYLVGTRDTWTEERTNPCQARETRPRNLTISIDVWRSDPDSGVWSGWSETGRTTRWGPWTPTSTYRGTGASRERRWQRMGPVLVTEQRTNPCQPTQTRSYLHDGGNTQNFGYEWRAAPE